MGQLYAHGATEVHCINLTANWKSEWAGAVKHGFIPVRFHTHNYALDANWSFAESYLLNVIKTPCYDLWVAEEKRSLQAKVELIMRQLTEAPPTPTKELPIFADFRVHRNPAHQLLKTFCDAQPVTAEATRLRFTADLERVLDDQERQRTSRPIANEGNNYDGRWQVFHNDSSQPSDTITVVGNKFQAGGTEYVIHERPQPVHFRWPDGTLQTGLQWSEDKRTLAWQAPGYKSIVWVRLSLCCLSPLSILTDSPAPGLGASRYGLRCNAE